MKANDYQPLGKRIGFKASDEAWAAHISCRKTMLRERFGALWGDVV